MFRSTKKEMVFFEDFNNIIDLIYQAAQEFEEMLSGVQPLPKYLPIIIDYENKCDQHCHKILERVNQSFITPIDREDIIAIAKALDDIMDQIEETASRLVIYNITELKPEAKQFGTLIKIATEDLQKLIRLIPKKSKDDMHHLIISVNQFENQGDALYRKELGNLFTHETDAIEVIKWKGIYDCFESSLDACEEVANLVEGIVMKNA